MSSTKFLIGGAVVAVVVAATPFFISKQVDAKLDETKALLKTYGLKQEITSKSGYLSGTRTFTLEIEDAQKARDFLLDALVSKNPQYKMLAETFKAESNADIREVFDGMGFKGEIKNSHLMPTDAAVSIALVKLPTAVDAALRKEEKSAKVVLPFIEKGALAFDMNVDKELKLKVLKMKDIKESLKFDEGTLNIDTKNHALTLSEQSNVLHGVFGIEKQNFEIASEEIKMNSNLANLHYTFDYKDQLNNKGDLSFGPYTLSVKEAGEDFSMTLGTMKISSKAEETNNAWAGKADYVMNNVEVKSYMDNLTVGRVAAGLSLDGLESATIKKLQNDYNALILMPDQAGNDQALANDVVALIRNGIKVSASVGVNDLKAPQNLNINLKDSSGTLTLTIEKNNFDEKQGIFGLLGLLKVNSKLKLHKEDRSMLEGLGLTSKKDFDLGKADGDYFTYDVEMNKGQLTVNGQAVQ